MNIVICGEDCRWQNDGACTLDDISRISSGGGNGCCYYEPMKITHNKKTGGE